MKYFLPLLSLLVLFSCNSTPQNKDPLQTEIVTSDLDNFWQAFEQAKPNFDPEAFQKLYLDKGSKGIKGFTPNRIKDAKNLAKVIAKYSQYYASIKPSTDSIAGMKDSIRQNLVKLKALYPEAIFPPVYFVIGALNSGGTSSNDGLIIGAEMYGLTTSTPKAELNDWLQTVIKPVNQVPHIVAHELIHFQQSYRTNNLLGACIKEGSADFIAELISGKHINQHVHEFANPKEAELWKEFEKRMYKDDYNGWLYSSVEGRPNDLGYWMGYKITKAYYDSMTDKQQAMDDIMNIDNFEEFLKRSKYSEKFN